MRTLAFIVMFMAAVSGTASGAEKAFDIDTMLRTRIITDLVAAPSGDFAVVRLSEYDGGDRFLSDYHMVKADGTVVRLTSGGGNYGAVALSPDGTRLLFAGERNGKHGLFVLPLTGGEAVLLKELAVDPDNLRWVNGRIFFSAMVVPSCSADFECTKKALEEKKKGPSAIVTDQLLHRPWNTWRNGTYSNLFMMDAQGKKAVPVFTGAFDVPQFPGGGREAYSVSEDGSVVVFSAKIVSNPASSTNFDLYETTRGADGSYGMPKKLTVNPGADQAPLLSPDGTRVAYLSQDTPGFESDLWRLRVLERKSGQITTLGEKLDRWVEALEWSPDGKKVHLVIEDAGYRPLYQVEAKKGAEPQALIGRITVRKIAGSKKVLWFTRESMTSPPELFSLDLKTGAQTLMASFNKDVLDGVKFGRVEEIWYEGSKGPDGKPRKIHAFLAMPPNTPEEAGPPVAVMVHGGPQGACMSNWHSRWNAMAFASMGFAVAMPNFTGSTGYGQEFTNAISKNWGGAPYDDIMALMDHLEKDPRLDAKNACAFGGSYGGYMTNWMEGRTDRFKCLVSHASVFNLTSKYGTTDELWFPEWEFGGSPWTSPEQYQKWSPHNYVRNFKTPILVVHGQNDFRVPVEQGLGMYQFAKVMGVEAKLVYFPDEDHFVNKPKNRKFWYETVGAWMKAHTGLKQ